jgi:hypothetical protein
MLWPSEKIALKMQSDESVLPFKGRTINLSEGRVKPMNK